MEYREFRAEGVETSDEGKLTGLVTPFDRETVIGDLKRGGWRETVKAGTFRKTLTEGDALMVYQHDLSRPMARKSAGNLDLAEGSRGDQRGLTVDADPVDTSYTRDCLKLVRAKVINGMSFGFNVKKDAWFDDDGQESDRFHGTRRELREVELIEVSPVTRPAYGGTAISARDEASALLEERAAKATYADLETCGECGATGQYGAYCSNCGKAMKPSKPSGDYCTSCGSKLDSKSRSSHECEEFRAEVDRLVEELRAASINTAGRKALAAKGHALPDGSYPIPDKSHLHAAAVLAASGHGDVKAAKALIRKRAKELGVDVKTLPGFGGDSDDRSDAPQIAITGTDYTDMAAQLIAAYNDLPADQRDALAPGVRAALDALRDSLRGDQEPDASTPDDEDDFALSVLMAQAKQRSRELGLA